MFLSVSEEMNFPLLSQLSFHAHFPLWHHGSYFSLPFVVLEFWGSECYEASRQAISWFGFLVRQVARMSSASLHSYIKPAISSPVTSDILKAEVTGHMMAQHLRQPGCSWANSQLWLRKRNKAALILLIGRNVLTKTRKRLIQMGLN